MKDSSFTATNGNVLHIPPVLGGDVPTYNLPEVKETLRLTPDVLADIFLGKITQGRDAGITPVRPRVQLPEPDLVVAHRADRCATPVAWADNRSYASAAAAAQV